jgi:shikimate dehydrogenase
MTQRVGIVGHPLQHSISPIFQQAALDHLSLDIAYEAWDTPPGDLAGLLAWLRRTPDALGANVTVPYKEEVFALVDRREGDAELLGAVNTLVAHEGEITGHNTDAIGFLRALVEDGGFDARGRSMLVLGAGGAARAVVVALARSGAAHIAIANRTVERGRALAGLSARHGAVATVVELTPQALQRELAERPWDLIVNATSVGMRHSATESESLLAVELIPQGALVCDLVYNPLVTPLLQAAQSAGVLTLSGLPMLVYQGAESFQFWTGVQPPIDVMMAAAREALQISGEGDLDGRGEGCSDS